jgi:tRNA-uridine 2-sulfurtransferase
MPSSSDLSGAKIAVGMSGGVDSTAAAALLVKSGAEVTGVTARMWDCADLPAPPGSAPACCSPRDMADAATACRKLGIEHFSATVRDSFIDAVLKPFCADYATGKTPSPCIICNRHIKFGIFLDRLISAGYQYFATGHYARISGPNQKGEYHLLRGTSADRDQSYFLSGLTQEQMARTLFPVGQLPKPEVRSIVADLGLPISEKPSSQEFCFAPDGNYDRVLAAYAPQALQPGPILDLAGNILGEHRGIGRYTIGQRRGLGIATGSPLYVLSILAAENTIHVGPDSALFQDGLLTGEINWIGTPPAFPFNCTVRIRHGGSDIPCSVSQKQKNIYRIDFDKPVRAIAPGQQAVLYLEDRVLGGGTILQPLAPPLY